MRLARLGLPSPVSCGVVLRWRCGEAAKVGEGARGLKLPVVSMARVSGFGERCARGSGGSSDGLSCSSAGADAWSMAEVAV